MRNEITIKVTGEAGQGLKTIGNVLCRIFKKAGFNIFANLDYMSRIRGGNNLFQLRVSSEKELFTLRKRSDIVVPLNKQSVDIHRKDMTDKGVMIVDPDKFDISADEDIFFKAPFYKIADQAGGSQIYVNSVACGMVSAIAGVECSCAEDILRNTFGKKEQKVVDRNIKAMKAGFEHVEKNFGRREDFMIEPSEEQSEKAGSQMLINGNQAIALGAIRAGCKFYSAYPMTPSTSIMTEIVHHSDRFGILVEQAEDELAAVNMGIGASFSGARSMASTSGGGLALMGEGISLAGMTETPLVLVDAQRPAPATGLPTRTEQSDLKFALSIGHGEFTRAVFSPGSAEECFEITARAFDIADKYQIPVLILTDQHLADSVRNMPVFDQEGVKAQKHVISKKDSKHISDYKRYRITDSGISPRAVPSWIDDVIYADSDEHSEAGHIIEDGPTRNIMMDKRYTRKMLGLVEEVMDPVTVSADEADVLLVGFGSTLGVLREACDTYKDKKVGFMHLPQVWPFPGEKVAGAIRKAKKAVTVENNATAQLAGLIREQTGIEVDHSILKFDGRPFDIDLITEELDNISI